MIGAFSQTFGKKLQSSCKFLKRYDKTLSSICNKSFRLLKSGSYELDFRPHICIKNKFKKFIHIKISYILKNNTRQKERKLQHKFENIHTYSYNYTRMNDASNHSCT